MNNIDIGVPMLIKILYNQAPVTVVRCMFAAQQTSVVEKLFSKS